MTNQIRPCERCRQVKVLFFEKRPGFVLLAAVLALGVAGAGLLIQGGLSKGLLLLAATPGALLLLSLVRVRCLRCEPGWKDRAWGIASS